LPAVSCPEIPPVLCFHTHLRLHLHSCTAWDCGLALTLVLDYRLPTANSRPYRLFSCTFRLGTSFLSPFEVRRTPDEASFSKGSSQETGVRTGSGKLPVALDSDFPRSCSACEFCPRVFSST
jgi:hypothetical protein